MAGLHKDKNGSLFEMTLTLPQTLNSLNLAAVPAWLPLLNQDASTKATKTFRGQTEFIEEKKKHISNAKMKKKKLLYFKKVNSLCYIWLFAAWLIHHHVRKGYFKEKHFD